MISVRMIAAVAGVTASLLLWQCSSDVAMGTSGSETGNARAFGIITDAVGKPVPSATVTFIPAGFDPRTSRIDTLPSAVTSSTGAYSVVIAIRKLYNLYATDSAAENQVLVPGLTTDLDSIRLDDYRLRERAGATILLSAENTSSSGSVYIPGTPFHMVKTAGTRVVEFIDIPAGVLPPAIGEFGGDKPVLVSDTMVTIEDSRVQATAIIVTDSVVALESELILIRRMVDSLGMRVTLTADENLLASDALGVDLVFVSSSADLGALLSTLRDVTPGVVVSESNMYPVMGMVADYSMAGTWNNQNTMAIVDPLHPIAAGLSDTVVVTSTRQIFGWGTPGSGAQIIAVDIANSQRAFIFCYEAGALLASGTPAAGRRCSMFLDQWGVTALNAQGWKLFDQALLWTAN